MSKVVIDASAVLAALNREHGHEKAGMALFQATISAVNYAEVLKKTAEVGGSIPTVQLLLEKQCLKIIPFDIQQAVRNAEIWQECKRFGLSFADRACVSLGLILDLPVVTADTSMSEVDLPVKFTLIR